MAHPRSGKNMLTIKNDKNKPCANNRRSNQPELVKQTPAMNFLDLETTGISCHYDQSIQIAQLITDEHLNIIDTFVCEASPSDHVLPSPGAIATMNIHHEAIFDRPNKPHQLMKKAEEFLQDYSPLTHDGYNSNGFDRKFIHHGRYSSLMDPYSSSKNGNRHSDTLDWCRWASGQDPFVLKVPEINGKPSFRLEHLARSNGYKNHKAHDALGDVEATIFLNKILKKQRPDIYEKKIALSNKAEVVKRLDNAEVVYLPSPNNSCKINPFAPISISFGNANERLMVRLDKSPETILSQVASKCIASKPCPIRSFKINLGLPFAVLDEEGFDAPDISAVPELRKRAALIQADHKWQTEVKATWRNRWSCQEIPNNVEEQLYPLGFPLQRDVRLMDDFHQSDCPDKKLSIANAFNDQRFRKIALRIIYEIAPEALSLKTRIDYEIAIKERLNTTRDVPWTTYKSALNEIDRLLPTLEKRKQILLRDYQSFLIHQQG